MQTGWQFRDPTAYYSLTEDHQIAVIDIQDAQNINIDMFISLTDSTNHSNEIQYMLPFYTKPENFQVEETEYEKFAEKKTSPLDTFIDVNSKWKDDARRNIFMGAAFGGITAGGPAAIGLLTWQLGLFNTHQGGGLRTNSLAPEKAPEEVITTEHSRTEVYNVSSGNDLEELLSKSELSDDAKQKIRDYKGTYIYFITLKTIPKTKPSVNAEENSRYEYNNRGGLNLLGMHFSFRTTAKDGTYTYPLSTGKTWHNPIKLTRVYIKNNRQTSLGIEYPKIGDKAESYDYYRLTSTYYYNDEKETKWDYASAEDAGSLVSRITYLNSNPDQDIKVKIAGSDGLSAFIGTLTALSRPFLTIVAPLLLLILPFVLWVAFFNRIMKKAVKYPTKWKMGKQTLMYYILNSFIQTSLTWMMLMGLVVAYIAIALISSQLSHYDYSYMSYGNIIFMLVLPPLFLIEVLIGSVAVSFIYKLHNKLHKMPWARFFALYLITLVAHFAVAAAFYFMV